MKRLFSFLVLNTVFGFCLTDAASSSVVSDHSQAPCLVGGIQIAPFFDSIPDLPEPRKYFRPFSGTYSADFDEYQRHLQLYRADARCSMEDGIVPVHALIRRLARRNITIAVENPENSLELIRNPSHFGDEFINSSIHGLSVKDSLAIAAKHKDMRCITRAQSIEILGADCVSYLEEVKNPETALWHAVHGKNTPKKVGYYGYQDTCRLNTSRKAGVSRLFISSDRKAYSNSSEIEDIALNPSEVRARQCAALLSIMRVCGEPVVQMCKNNVVVEWLTAYGEENPCSWLRHSSENYPSMPTLAYGMPTDSCTVI